jgi:hypothetical protein
MCRGERFSPDRPCRVVGRREEGDASPPRMTGVLGELRASVPVTCGWSRGTGCSRGCGPSELVVRSFSRASMAMLRQVERRG